MKILIKQFLGQLHSWSNVGWNLSEALLNLNNKVDLFPTDGIKHLPPSLNKNVIGYLKELNLNEIIGNIPNNNYDIALSYTAMPNFANYLSHGKNKFAIWAYEFFGKNILPTGFAKNHIYCDYIFPPSQFAKQIFLDSNIPEEKLIVLPHGINKNQYSQNTKLNLSNKKYKILINLAQNHTRKNIPGMLEAYGKAFNNKDDVCLIIKGKHKKVTSLFEVSLNDTLSLFYKKFPNHAEVKLYSDYIEDISILYRSVDTTFNLSRAECFHFPSLESIASGKLVIAPNWGGQLDFLNLNNSIIISGKETRVDPKNMYWEQKNNAIWFEPNIDEAAEKLKFAFSNFEKINSQIEKDREIILDNYSWYNIAQKLLEFKK
jgi:glycosyltransferase involved in cell wall biosynthesis